MTEAARRRAALTQIVLADPAIDRLTGLLALLGYTLAPMRLPRLLRKGDIRVHMVFRRTGADGTATLRYQRTVSVP